MKAEYFLLEEKAADEGRDSPVAQTKEQMGLINCKLSDGREDSMAQTSYTLCNTWGCL